MFDGEPRRFRSTPERRARIEALRMKPDASGLGFDSGIGLR